MVVLFLTDKQNRQFKKKTEFSVFDGHRFSPDFQKDGRSENKKYKINRY